MKFRPPKISRYTVRLNSAVVLNVTNFDQIAKSSFEHDKIQLHE